MYIVAIGWIYVTLMMALVSPTLISGVSLFLFYGLFPSALLLWIVGAPARGRVKKRDRKNPPPKNQES
ncbi:MAG: hypothetical protein KGI54_02170 [Pseudomonadota bacterium]|nr:hypothetical protein [Pseudomonadota bacterium]